jgi:hypothetical protein
LPNAPLPRILGRDLAGRVVEGLAPRCHPRVPLGKCGVVSG